MAAKNFPFSDGRGGTFFRDTTTADQPIAPVKGNRIGRAEKRKSTVKPSTGKNSMAGRFPIPNQDVTNGPPKSAGWQSLSQPYQASRQLHSGLRFKKGK